MGLAHEVSYIALDTGATEIETGSLVRHMSRMNVVSITGVLLDSERSWYLQPSDSLPSPCTIGEIADSTGEWLALATAKVEDRNHFLCIGDPSGFCPVFYSLVPNKALVVSDSFSGVVRGVRNVGGAVSLNSANYLALLSGKTATFNNLISNQTMANEINILSHNESLYIDESRVTILSRSSVSKAKQINSYKTALSEGVKTASETITNFVKNSREHRPLLTLTGGVDSRMVLALLATTGILPQFRIWSMDPRDARRPQQKKVHTADVEISNELRRRYGLEWMDPRVREKLSVSYEENLAYYQSFNSNFAFTFAPANHISIDVEPILTLRGGGGEILRGGSGARVMGELYTEYRREGGVSDPVEWAAKHYTRQSIMLDQTKELVEGFLVASLAGYQGSLLRETIDSFYRDTRNRGHFGHSRQSATTNDRLMQALANPFLVRAAELSEYDARVSGRVVVDLFEKTDPKLREFPFEDASATAFITRRRRKQFKFKNRHGWQPEFDALKRGKVPTRYSPSGEPGSRGEFWEFSAVSKATSFIRSGFNDIVDLVDVKDQEIFSKQHDLILQSLQKNALSPGHTSAKVASALDVVAPMPLDRAGTHLFTDPNRIDRIKASSPLLYSASPYFLDTKRTT